MASSSNTPPDWLKISGEMDEQTLNEELEDLLGYYKSFMKDKIEVNVSTQWLGARTDGDRFISFLLQESSLPLSELVHVTFDRLIVEVANGNVILAEPLTYDFVRNTILHEGSRVSYGIQPHEDANIWEDITPLNLWCWEVRFGLHMLSKTLHFCNVII